MLKHDANYSFTTVIIGRLGGVGVYHRGYSVSKYFGYSTILLVHTKKECFLVIYTSSKIDSNWIFFISILIHIYCNECVI